MYTNQHIRAIVASLEIQPSKGIFEWFLFIAPGGDLSRAVSTQDFFGYFTALPSSVLRWKYFHFVICLSLRWTQAVTQSAWSRTFIEGGVICSYWVGKYGFKILSNLLQS